MGAIAEAIVTYTQPLFDATDGSLEQMNRASALGMLCWNLAITPEDAREAALAEMRPELKMDDDEFEEFRQSFLIPMIERHKQMFPRMHQKSSLRSSESWQVPPSEPSPTRPAPVAKDAAPGRYDPCPCNSGEKYKFCCGRR